jgi:hypothetical protein
MRRWVLRGVLLVMAGALAIWGWLVFFPSPEQAIRKQVAGLAQAASFSGKESPLAQLSKIRRLGDHCTLDVQVTVDVPGYSRESLTGRDAVMQAAAGARSVARSFSVDFVDVVVKVGADKTSAVVNLTAKGKVSGERDWLVQELQFTLQKVNGDWLISRAETVKTLL